MGMQPWMAMRSMSRDAAVTDETLAPGLLLLSYRAEFTAPDSPDLHRMLVTSIWQQRGETWVNVFSQDTGSHVNGASA